MTKKILNREFEFPHVIILLSIMILFACILTYIVPAGVYDMVKDPNTGRSVIDPNSFHYVENTPVSPLKAFLNIQKYITKGGYVISLLLILGASTEVLVASGAIESLVDTGIARFKDKSTKVVIPMIYVLMAVLGALCGNDSMIAYIAIGLAIAMKLKLDKLAAVSMFYLPYIQGQAAGPTTAIILTAQKMLELPPLSGALVRIVIWALFTTVGAIFTTKYALKIAGKPENSILEKKDCFTEDVLSKDLEKHNGKLDYRAVLSVTVVVFSYVFYAYGAKAYGWSWNYLTACIMASSIMIAVFYRQRPNYFAQTFFRGAVKMGGVCLLIGFAKSISGTLTDGQIIHTITNSTIGLIDGFGSGFAAIGMYIFNLLFNFMVPSGTTQAAIILPITTPISDVMGISRQVTSLVLQLGDGLTNCLTPLSAPLMGALALGGISYTKWVKYAGKIVLINVIIGGIAIFILQGIGWA